MEQTVSVVVRWIMVKHCTHDSHEEERIFMQLVSQSAELFALAIYMHVAGVFNYFQ